jgi:hypothetical protein
MGLTCFRRSLLPSVVMVGLLLLLLLLPECCGFL